MTAETCTSAYQSFQARVDSMGYEINQFRCDNGLGEYDIKTFRYVLAARGTTYEPFPPYAHHMNGLAEGVIRKITEKARAMISDSQAPIQVWGEAVNTAVYLYQRSPNDGLKRSDGDGFQVPYEMHTKCCMDLENLRTMPMVTRYRIKLLSTTYANSDATPADSSPMFSAEANLAQDQSPA